MHRHGKHSACDKSGVLEYTSVRWLSDATFGRAERTTLPTLVAVKHQAMTTQQVADAAGYEATGGGFQNTLSWLRRLALIEGCSEMRAILRGAE